eukprot:CAMPEP_0113311152 /NCGR_PEP_ID=MMETSP0010_2-20120614/8503_1 /TAXON_ID=216773 ORGANISM="Corethron hystrix, Strain 308" /NCGR_SAMPLE_ID=MMETSP0010_2 /ASSEMBLY_ACC=CAM_ASM_000155 /LENGTH=217 /DNA_ID=CAMNT_0000166733 /DNA_START=444 /DNA_END=1097 /DNA_ORIENTATION=+ /assembly_acc=CAM_ASM_000155
MLRSTEESKTVAPEMSLSLPFMERPSTLTGAYAGDVGFDPVGFSKTEPELKNYREAEIKHSRLAMLAAAGWPISEILDKKIAGIFNLSPLVDGSDRVPSVLNGGLGQVSPIYWAAVIALASGVEIIGLKNVNDEGYTPGDYKFDPLGLYPSDEAGQMSMQLAEIKHGRLAMIAITAFAVQEAVSKLGVVDETPFFFRPITYWGTILHDYANSGYISN